MTTDAGTPTPAPMPLRKAMERAFHLGQTYWQQADHEFISQQRKADVTQQTFRDFADATCAQYDGSLTAAEAERDALRQAMGFAQGAIEDAIYTEDGLDGETGERVLHIMQEAVERGTFDQTQIGSLPRPMLETENDALRARVAGLENSALELSVCLRNLVFMAETSGGTAGRDEALCTAIAQARALLAPSSEPQP